MFILIVISMCIMYIFSYWAWYSGEGVRCLLKEISDWQTQLGKSDFVLFIDVYSR